uniref:Uncharacterized protein n=1 Tax=Glossina palpalis gambiensis TaxID=67801 RepID=A0A1B0C321_9MUSC
IGLTGAAPVLVALRAVIKNKARVILRHEPFSFCSSHTKISIELLPTHETCPDIRISSVALVCTSENVTLSTKLNGIITEVKESCIERGAKSNEIRSKKLQFAKISDDIEERVAMATSREEEKVRYYTGLEEQNVRHRSKHTEDYEDNRERKVSSSGSVAKDGKNYEREFGETTESKLHHSNGASFLKPKLFFLFQLFKKKKNAF